MTQYLGGTHQIQYGTSEIQYELIYTDRDNLAIHVHPDCSVLVEAPLNSEIETIKAKVKNRARWILKQQHTFRSYTTPEPNRMYVSGETHFYLGKQYRLKVIQSEFQRVQFNRGQIFLYVNNTDDWNLKQKLLERWYRARAKFVFQERLQVCYRRFEGLDIPFPEVQIRPMKSQWGNCTVSGKIVLNLKLIKVSKKLVDYVVIHELCHLKEHNHSRAFYELLEQILPNWCDLRHELNQIEFN